MSKRKFSSEFDMKDVDVKSISPLYDGFFKIDLYQLEHARFAGGKLTGVNRELFIRGHAAAVLPYDPVKDRIVLVEQFRVGAMATKQSPWLLEVVAGMIEPKQSPEQVATREAHEEAGIEVRELIPMLDYMSSPGGTTERIHLFLGIIDSEGVGGIHGLESEHEDIKVHVFDYDDALHLLQSGELDNAATVISMQWLALNKQKLFPTSELNN
ncbi:MAG: NUDIX domain-containing protein [Gammaproteobacteria bacterium]|nr:NUDIX domain-containing protein [Gammaproteobacteria bacterium]